MLAAVQREDFSAVRLWRTRALARFTAIGWVEGVALLIMGEAFSELARVNDDYPAGRTLDLIRPSAVALGIISELERFTVGQGTEFRLGPSAPSQPVLRRLFHEKRGFLLLLDGDYDSARASYDKALVAAGSHQRGRVKVRLGRLLVDYVSLESDDGKDGIATETLELSQGARNASSTDVAEAAETNATVMREGGRNLLPYEIL
jgi:hypothetical protein